MNSWLIKKIKIKSILKDWPLRWPNFHAFFVAATMHHIFQFDFQEMLRLEKSWLCCQHFNDDSDTKTWKDETMHEYDEWQNRSFIQSRSQWNHSTLKLVYNQIRL